MSDFINCSQIEVLSATDGVRRRSWSDDDKLRIVEESFIGHRQVTATARRHGICRSLLTTWRRQYRNGELGSSRPVSFTSVSVTQSATTPQSGSLSSCPSPACQIEIALPNGRRLIVPAGVEPAALARVLAVVDPS